MRRIRIWAVLLGCLGSIPIGASDWITHSGDLQRTGWQRDEAKISKETVKNLQLLWKIRLDTRQRSVYALYGPLIVERAITDRGFKELALVAGAGNDLFAVDADLGTLFWKKHFDWHAEVPETDQVTFLCPGGLTAWPVLQGGRGRGAGAPPQRGASPFAVRTMFVVSGDGDLHAVNINTGDDVGAPMKFLPPNGKPYSLALANNVIYAITGQGCGGNPNSVYSLDLEDSAKTVRVLAIGERRPVGNRRSHGRHRRHDLRRDRRRSVRAGVESICELGSRAHTEGAEAEGLVHAVERRVAVQARPGHERHPRGVSLQRPRPARGIGEGRPALPARQPIAWRRRPSHAAVPIGPHLE